MNFRELPIKIKSFASYLPEQVISNDEIMQKYNDGKGDGRLLHRAVGSVYKRAARSDEMGSDMVASVGAKLLAENGLKTDRINKLICSIDPQDHTAPDSSVVAQTKLNLTCPAFGVSMSCVGWLCGINIAANFLLGGDRVVMVIGCSTVGSKYYFASPIHRAIFGDGAGGAIIERCEGPGNIYSVDLMAVGQFYKKIFGPHPWTSVPDEIPEKFKKTFFMSPDNRIFFEALDTHIRPFYKRQFDVAGVSIDEIDHFVVHQASMPLFNYTVESFGIPKNKTIDCFDQYGNTISAELPIIMDLKIREGVIKKGDLVYLLTYGAGFTAGAMIMRV